MATFQLERCDVVVSAVGGRLSGRTKVRHSRKLDLSSWKYTLTHGPTGVQVSGEVKGYYSRRQFSPLKDDLLRRLWDQLERKVAAHLRISGQ